MSTAVAEYPLDEVLAIAQAVERYQGYVRGTVHFCNYRGGDCNYSNNKDKTSKEPFLSNRQIIQYHMDPEVVLSDVKVNEEQVAVAESIKVTANDLQEVDEIKNYLLGLALKKIERPLSSFEESALNLVSTNKVTQKDLPLAASLPNIYKNSKFREDWQQRERYLSSKSDFVGTLGKKVTEHVRVEHVIRLKDESKLVCTSTQENNIVKFFVSYDRLHMINGVDIGDTITVKGIVKKQEVSAFHGGKETMLNRVQIGY